MSREFNPPDPDSIKAAGGRVCQGCEVDAPWSRITEWILPGYTLAVAVTMNGVIRVQSLDPENFEGVQKALMTTPNPLGCNFLAWYAIPADVPNWTTPQAPERTPYLS